MILKNKKINFKKMNLAFVMMLIISLVIGTSACHSSGESGNEHGNREKSESRESGGEHESSEKGHDEAGEDEEDGTQIGINETYEGVRRGVQMTLAYNAEKDAFTGMVTNITTEVIPQVRVEVHLSNKVELGPTPRADLAPGESREINLSAEGNSFESWSTHAESGKEEGHANEEEGKKSSESHEESKRGEHI